MLKQGIRDKKIFKTYAYTGYCCKKQHKHFFKDQNTSMPNFIEFDSCGSFWICNMSMEIIYKNLVVLKTAEVSLYSESYI